MKELLTPIKSESLKEVFISRFEELILSGKLSIGQKLPSERELAMQLGVSRPVVHEGLVDLANKGLVSMKPRAGAFVNDYRKEGSLTLLTSLFNYHNGELDPRLLLSVLEMRMLFEVETARLSALNRTDEHLNLFCDILREEDETDISDIDRITGLDFDFHHLIAFSSGNMIYPLILNSFKQFYVNLTGKFFSEPTVVNIVFSFHGQIVEAIKDQDESRVVVIMKDMLKHGEENLKVLRLNI